MDVAGRGCGSAQRAGFGRSAVPAEVEAGAAVGIKVGMAVGIEVGAAVGIEIEAKVKADAEVGWKGQGRYRSRVEWRRGRSGGGGLGGGMRGSLLVGVLGMWGRPGCVSRGAARA